MENDEFVLFRKYSDIGSAQNLANIFEDNGINYELVDSSPPVDITFTGNPLEKEFDVMVKQSDFEKANKLLEGSEDLPSEPVLEDHYLNDFTNEELFEILKEFDEWSAKDFHLAQKILAKRGEEVDEETLSKWKNERLKYLAAPEKSKPVWIAIGYIFSLTGGLLGILIGWLLMISKKTLPNGKKVPIYSDKDRKHGRNMVLIGIIISWLII